MLAPISLIAFVVVLLIVIASSGTDEDSGESGNGISQQQQTEQVSTTGETTTTTTPTTSGKFYTVKTGDTLAGIAEQVGVSVAQLQELNPALDPQALVSGQKIRIRE